MTPLLNGCHLLASSVLRTATVCIRSGHGEALFLTARHGHDAALRLVHHCEQCQAGRRLSCKMMKLRLLASALHREVAVMVTHCCVYAAVVMS